MASEPGVEGVFCFTHILDAAFFALNNVHNIFGPTIQVTLDLVFFVCDSAFKSVTLQNKFTGFAPFGITNCHPLFVVVRDGLSIKGAGNFCPNKGVT